MLIFKGKRYHSMDEIDISVNAKIARIYAEMSFWMALIALSLASGIAIVALMYLTIAYPRKKDTTEDTTATTNASVAIINPALDRQSAFLARAVCSLDSATSSFCNTTPSSCNSIPFSCRTTSSACCFRRLACIDWNKLDANTFRYVPHPQGRKNAIMQTL